jgi:hypothetical protein
MMAEIAKCGMRSNITFVPPYGPTWHVNGKQGQRIIQMSELAHHPTMCRRQFHVAVVASTCTRTYMNSNMNLLARDRTHSVASSVALSLGVADGNESAWARNCCAMSPTRSK